MINNSTTTLAQRWRLNILNRIGFVRKFLALIIFGVLTYCLVFADIPTSSKFEIGKPAPIDARAEYTVRLVDEAATKKAMQDAASQVADVEVFNPYALQSSEARIDNTISYVRMTLPDAEKKDKDKAEQLPTASSEETPSDSAASAERSSDNQQAPLQLSDAVHKILINANDKELKVYSSTAKHLLRQTMSGGIRKTELNQAAAAMIGHAAALDNCSSKCKVVAVELASKALIPNLSIDSTATENAKRKASEEVIPIVKVILPGQIVVREGEIVTKEDIPVLEALDYYHHKLTFRELTVKSLLVIVVMAIAITFVRICVPKVYDDSKKLAGLALITVIYAVSSHSMIAAGVIPQITPITIPAILIAILYDSELAILISILLALYTSAETHDLAATTASILTSMVAVLSVKKISKRWDLIRSSIIIWGSSVLFNGLVTVNNVNELQSWALSALCNGSLSGLVFSLIASGILPFLESILDIVSHMRLLELSNPSEPILQELLAKAPGTYQHSLMVSNLAAAAALDIGADAMLCRTGAFYHDIGKTKQPNMFIENQFGHENPHDKLAPSLSAMILISHVRFGQEMASQYKLPQAIRQFINEHHGTNLASFFFQKAQEMSDEPLFEDDFRYPGPKPQSKETAIVMICDGIEAAARTLHSHSKEAIQNLVDRMVDNIVRNGQLDECELSMRDITKIKKSVTFTLTSHYHSRISYPNMANSSGASAGAKDKEPSGNQNPEKAVKHQSKDTDRKSSEDEVPQTLPAASTADADNHSAASNHEEKIAKTNGEVKPAVMNTTAKAEEKACCFPAAQKAVKTADPPKNSD